MQSSQEPPFNQDDTQPTQTITAVDDPTRRDDRLRLVVILVGTLIVLVLTITATLIIFNSGGDDPETTVADASPQPTNVGDQAVVPEATADATSNAQAVEPTTNTDASVASLSDVPTVDESVLESRLNAPLESLNVPETILLSTSARNPFTVVPDRPRDQIEQYTVVQGDTIEAIATRFGLQPESIVWSNPRRIIQVLRPGDVLIIPPEDGVFVYAQGVSNTIADYAARYEVPVAAVLSHPANRAIASMPPETVPPSGTPIFFPGGVAEVIVWRADIEVSGGSNGSTGGSGGGVPTVRFQPGQPGDCGNQPIVGGTQWVNPVPSGYTITTGYSSYHPGLDLAGSIGVPIVAANGGRVIFAGWNGFGYGYMVALIHGPAMTVYGHMSVVQVSCGQDVAAGQQIGLMGSSGQSSGPHLHFEVRGAPSYLPFSPSSVIGF
jgi:murein DD-endopeptidase MepM/ murein hydrolase activator NlpD